MPSKKAKQGHVEGARRADRQLTGGVEPRRQEVRLGLELPLELESGRNDGPEEGRRPQGRQGGGEEALGEQVTSCY